MIRWCISLLSITTMDSSLKLFQLVQKFYQTMGIYPSLTLNWKNLIFLLAMILQLIGLFAFFLFESTIISERGMVFFGITTNFYSLSDYSITLWRIPEILKLIELCEKFIEKSMYYTLIWLTYPLFYWLFIKNRIKKWSDRCNPDKKIL